MDTAESQGQRSRQKRGRISSHRFILTRLLIFDHELLQFLKHARKDFRHVPVLRSCRRRRRGGVVDVATGIASGGDDDDLVELVEKQNRIQERKNLQRERRMSGDGDRKRKLGLGFLRDRERERDYVIEEFGEGEIGVVGALRETPKERVCVE